MFEDIITMEWSEGAQDLHLLVADRVGTQAGGGLHGREGEELEQMILDHVTHGPRGVVVTGASLDAERFDRSDLNVADVIGIPKRFEDRICKAHHHDVLGCFLAQIMVNAVGVALWEDFADKGVEKLCAFEILAEGLLHDHAGPASLGGSAESALTQVAQNDWELVGCHGQVVEAVAACAAVAICLIHL